MLDVGLNESKMNKCETNNVHVHQMFLRLHT